VAPFPAESAWEGLVLAQSGHSGAAQSSADEVSRQLVKERFGVLQDRRVETFGEPAVDGGEKIAGFAALALVTPEAGEARGGAQLPEFGTLLLRNCQREAKAILRCGALMWSSSPRMRRKSN
jgi:hypothetical protein